MRQFDVVENPSSNLRRYAPYLVVLQSHLLDALDTIVVAPLIVDAERPVTVIDLGLTYNDDAFILAVSEMAAVDRNRLKGVHGSMVEHEYEIRRALDRIFTGF